MICYEVTLNREHLYTAGMEEADQFEARLDKVPGTTAIVLSVSDRGFDQYARLVT